MDSRIPDYAAKFIREEVRREYKDFRQYRGLGFSGITAVESYVYTTFVVCWKNWGFTSEQEAARIYDQFITSERIRTWFRRNHISQRKGPKVYCFDGRTDQDFGLWNVVSHSGLDSSSNGVFWSVRKVDGLKNIYVWFR